MMMMMLFNDNDTVSKQKAANSMHPARKESEIATRRHFFRPTPYSEVSTKLESSPHTSAKAMLFARWQHHLWFCSGFPYAPLKAMITKISKWSKTQDSFRITPKIKSLVVFAIPDIPSKFQIDPSITFWVILLTHRQTDRQTSKQTKSGKNITSLAEVKIFIVVVQSM